MQKQKPKFDRAAEDLANIVGLEHVNVLISDQGICTTFYISGLGLTRDPYMMTGTDNMWVNVGKSQFHLITGKPQVLRGRIGLVVPDLDALVARLERVKPKLEGTKFSYKRDNGHVDATCPWGNRIRCHAPDEKYGHVYLGMPYLEFDVPTGTAPGIARFYKEVMGATATVEKSNTGDCAIVDVGQSQEFRFKETDAKLPDYDGHHIQVYVSDFSGPHKKLLARDLVTEESDQYQYRFKDIVDPKDGKHLFTIEHEVRSMTHPLYARPLVNRNPAATNRNYAHGYDSFVPGQGLHEVTPGRFM